MLALSSLLTVPVAAQDNDFFSNLEVGDQDGQTGSDGPLSLIGWITAKASYGYEQPDPPFSRTGREITGAETSLFAQLDWRLAEQINLRFSGKAYHDAVYELEDDTRYSAAEKNLFRNRYEIKDFYLETSFDNGVYLKFGNQIQAWGFAEFLRVTDLVNTEDQYTFGQQDLEDLRLQVPAAQVSKSLGRWVFDGVVTYRAGYNDLSPSGDEFDPFIALRQPGYLIDRNDPDDQAEYFLRASTSYASGDVQIVAADFNDNRLTLDGISGASSVTPLLHVSQQRMQALGLAANRVSGSWLWFGELGLHQNVPVMPARNDIYASEAGWQERDQLLGVLGLEYHGFTNTLLSLELDTIQTRGSMTGLGVDRSQVSYGARVYWTGMNERLEVLSVVNALSENQGYLTRFTLDYNWSDNWKFGLLWMDYSAEQDSVYRPYRNNDLLQLNARFSFQY